MADFCKQCSLETFGRDYRELAELLDKEHYIDGYGSSALCEGCGPTVVDYEGKCMTVCIKKHGCTSNSAGS